MSDLVDAPPLATSILLIAAVPLVGSVKPMNKLIVVLLPAPLAPSKAYMVPFFTCRSRFVNALLSLYCLLNAVACINVDYFFAVKLYCMPKLNMRGAPGLKVLLSDGPLPLEAVLAYSSSVTLYTFRNSSTPLKV